METAWIDFKEIKAGLDVRAVLDFFGVQLNGKGDQLHGFCPLPAHAGKQGKAKSFFLR